MSDEERINPGHAQLRKTLRFVGPLALTVGVLFMIVGLGSFFSAFGGHGTPRYFWCCFVGMPLIGVGMVMCQFGYLGAIMRYQASEIAPVGKDTFNYMADGTKDGVKTVAAAVSAGMREGISGAEIQCPHCRHSNDIQAKFCADCGKPISKSCAACGQVNEGDAKFCDSCGNQFGS